MGTKQQIRILNCSSTSLHMCTSIAEQAATLAEAWQRIHSVQWYSVACKEQTYWMTAAKNAKQSPAPRPPAWACYRAPFHMVCLSINVHIKHYLFVIFCFSFPFQSPGPQTQWIYVKSGGELALIISYSYFRMCTLLCCSKGLQLLH